MRYLLFLLIFCSFVYGNPPPFEGPSEAHLNALYHSLTPQSIGERFAFYHLYPNTPQGKGALREAWALLTLHRKDTEQPLEGPLALPSMTISPIIALVNKEPFSAQVKLSEEELTLIDKISDHLGNRTLKGFGIWEREELLLLPPEEIDLARALLLCQFENEEGKELKVRQYEASLDLIALQILAHLPKNKTALETIHAINAFIFYEKRFRFPPHSLWAKEIDLYTFLPSVLDNRLGVCLGVSMLYLCIAQRLNLHLEIITPPGHIYLRYQMGDMTLNIETTARGISLPSKLYLGINTRKLQQRTMKEVIGLAFINQASVLWRNGKHQETVDLYEKARLFLPHDPLLKMLLGYNYLFTDQLEKGTALLKEISTHPFDYAVYKETTPEDFLNGDVDIEAIKTLFIPVDETRDSILDKQKQLKSALKKYPKFRDGHFQLAITYLQLGRGQEALNTLTTYHKLDPYHPSAQYYLSIVSMERFLYQNAWTHLKAAQKSVSARDHFPDCLTSLHHHLRTLCPDPAKQSTPRENDT